MSARFEKGKVGKSREGPPRICVVPCSGIGKSYGSVTREAAYVVTEELRPDATQIVPLSLLVLGDADAQAAVRAAPVITLDGCKLACASVNVRQAGGAVAQGVVVLDFYRQHRDLKPQGIAELNEGGLALARALAEEIAATCDRLEAAEEPQHA
jgi:uncharacterized metal-binding protein